MFDNVISLGFVGGPRLLQEAVFNLLRLIREECGIMPSMLVSEIELVGLAKFILKFLNDFIDIIALFIRSRPLGRVHGNEISFSFGRLQSKINFRMISY